MDTQRLEVFRTNYLVFGLPPEKVEEITKLASFETRLVNEDICVRGEKGCDLFVILDGRVNITSQHGEKLAEIGPGAVIGEIALVDGKQSRLDNVKYWGAQKNDGFMLAYGTHHYKGFGHDYSLEKRNGFFIHIESSGEVEN